jgi:hypothetical protein
LALAPALGAPQHARVDAVGGHAGVLDGLDELPLANRREILEALIDAHTTIQLGILDDYGLTQCESTLMGLDEGEVVVYEGDAAILERERYFQGQAFGVSIPLGRGGPRIHMGQFTGRKRLDATWSARDEGVLSVTTERVVFRGEMQVVEIGLDQIVGLDLEPDALRIQGALGRLLRLPEGSPRRSDNCKAARSTGAASGLTPEPSPRAPRRAFRRRAGARPRGPRARGSTRCPAPLRSQFPPA